MAYIPILILYIYKYCIEDNYSIFHKYVSFHNFRCYINIKFDARIHVSQVRSFGIES